MSNTNTNPKENKVDPKYFIGKKLTIIPIWVQQAWSGPLYWVFEMADDHDPYHVVAKNWKANEDSGKKDEYIGASRSKQGGFEHGERDKAIVMRISYLNTDKTRGYKDVFHISSDYIDDSDKVSKNHNLIHVGGHYKWQTGAGNYTLMKVWVEDELNDKLNFNPKEIIEKKRNKVTFKQDYQYTNNKTKELITQTVTFGPWEVVENLVENDHVLPGFKLKKLKNEEPYDSKNGGEFYTGTEKGKYMCDGDKAPVIFHLTEVTEGIKDTVYLKTVPPEGEAQYLIIATNVGYAVLFNGRASTGWKMSIEKLP